jgi:HEAT repeat protein
MTSIALRWSGLAGAGCLTVFGFAAAEAFAGQQAPSAKDLSTVIEMLRSPDPVVRVSVACARNVFNPSAAPAIPALVELLEDAEPVAPEVCREDHRRWWGDERPITPGEAAARALVHIGSASLDPLIKTLASPAAVARRNAAWALGALDDQRAVTPLIDSLRDSDPNVREQAAWALGAIDDARAVQPLVNALRDPSSRARRQSAWALGAIDDANAVDGLVAALKDSDAGVREQAAWALGAIGDGRAGAGLGLALKDTEARVRRQAAWALGVIAD